MAYIACPLMGRDSNSVYLYGGECGGMISSEPFDVPLRFGPQMPEI
jgi:hypothetical protein